ncbi:MAG: hypothetical protein ACKVX7_09760 [Planctomycetota bacterium]
MKTVRILGAVAAILLAATTGARAQISSPILLNVSGTTYFDDCDPGTACLVVYCGAVEGDMTLEFSMNDGTFDVYDVTDLNWTLYTTLCPPSTAGTPHAVTGGGTFSVDPLGLTGRMELSLDAVDIGGPFPYDSGVVNLIAPFPQIQQLTISHFDTTTSYTINASAIVVDWFYRRGDANDDDQYNIADAITTLSALFVVGTPPLHCVAAADSNGDELFDIADAIYTLSALFVPGAPPPPAPHPDCGGASPGVLPCEFFCP